MSDSAHQRGNGTANKLSPQDAPAHAWYRFVLSFPPHLVRDYLRKFGVTPHQRVLDPFCGTGTVLVECKKLGIQSVGIEAIPMAHFASIIKTDWSIDGRALIEHAHAVADECSKQLARDGIEDAPLFQARHPVIQELRTLSPEQDALLLANSISPLPLHKVLVLRDTLKDLCDERLYQHEMLGLAKALVSSIGNLHFGPEVGVGPSKVDCPTVEPWLREVANIGRDLETLKDCASASAVAFHGDARKPSEFLEPRSIDAVITSPPYPNEKDYTRTTRLESVILGLVEDKADLRVLKRRLVRSNTRSVYKEDDDDKWVETFENIQALSHEIESRRLELGKTSGFERLYARVTKLYFGGMARHLADLRTALRPGAKLAYVVGDQASYLRIMIRTGTIIADIAKSLGYRPVGIDLFRTRLATATRQQLREEVVVLEWPG